jgi:polyisoprenoid-binding protein YceI
VEPALPREDTRYTVDCDASVIHWFGRNGTTTHYGTVGLSSGEMGIRKGKIRGFFEIDMTSIRDLDLAGDPDQPMLLSHLRSEDFFFVRMFPTASFTITSAEQIEEVPSSLPNFRVRGVFDLRGITHEIEFFATVGALEAGEVRVESHFDFDRTRWGVLYGSSRFFEHLGFHLVHNSVSIHLRLVGRLK